MSVLYCDTLICDGVHSFNHITQPNIEKMTLIWWYITIVYCFYESRNITSNLEVYHACPNISRITRLISLNAGQHLASYRRISQILHKHNN